MRFVLAIVIILAGFSIRASSSRGQAGCDSIPILNQKIITYVRSTVNKKVGHGECWDLAAQALNQNQAVWDHNFKFGRQINPGKECVYPGDIIQFEGVVVKYRKDSRDYQETMQHHTAIIYEVKDTGIYVLIHQNTAFSGRKVGFSDLDLKTIVRGKFKIYRPVN